MIESLYFPFPPTALYLHNCFFGEMAIAIMRILYIKHHRLLLKVGQLLTGYLILTLTHLTFGVVHYFRVNAKNQIDVDMWQVWSLSSFKVKGTK